MSCARTDPAHRPGGGDGEEDAEMITMTTTAALTGLPCAGGADLRARGSAAPAVPMAASGWSGGARRRVPEAFIAALPGTGLPVAGLPVAGYAVTRVAAGTVTSDARQPKSISHTDVPNDTTLGIHLSRRPPS